jgi:hypothetical protein
MVAIRLPGLGSPQDAQAGCPARTLTELTITRQGGYHGVNHRVNTILLLPRSYVQGSKEETFLACTLQATINRRRPEEIWVNLGYCLELLRRQRRS